MQRNRAQDGWDTLFESLLADRDLLTSRVREQMQSQLPAYARLPAEILDPVVWGEIEGLLWLTREGKPSADLPDLDQFAQVGATRASQGVPLEDVLRAWRLGVRIILDRAREQGDAQRIGAEEILDFAESLLASSDIAMVQLAGGHRAVELEAIRHDQEQCMQLVRDVLLGSGSPTDICIKAPAYGFDPDLSYVAVRGRPAAGGQVRDLERALGFLDAPPYRRGLSTLIEGEVAGFLREPPAPDHPGVIGIGPAGRLDNLEHSFRIASRALATATAFDLSGARDMRSLGVLPAVLADRDVGETLRARYLAPLEASGSPVGVPVSPGASALSGGAAMAGDGVAPAAPGPGAAVPETAQAGTDSAASNGAKPVAPRMPGKAQGTKAQAGGTGDCSKPIVIGSVGEYSGVLGSILTSGTVVVRSWAASVNATGGLNCHQVKYVVYDEGGDPSRAQALTRRAVEEDGVIAFVYNGFALAGQASVNYIQDKQIPVIGEEGGNAWSCTNTMYFPVMSTCAEAVAGNYQLLGKVAPREDNKVAAVTCVEVPYCAAFHDGAAAAAKEAGLELVYNGSMSLTQPDYTSSCLFAQRAGASMVMFGGDSTSMSRFLTSGKSVNYQPILAGPGSAFSPQSPTAPELQGVWTASYVRVAPVEHPAIAALLRVMRTYAPAEPLVPNGAIGWVSAQVFAEALRNVSGNPTSQDVLNGLWSIKNYTAGDMTRPLTFTKNGLYRPLPRCWFPVQIKNKQLVASPKLCS